MEETNHDGGFPELHRTPAADTATQLKVVKVAIFSPTYGH